MKPRNKNDVKYFVFLDGLRGLAAISVVLLHWLDGHARTMFGSSILAVDFFFLLSGFVIAHAYEERLSNGYARSTFFLTRLIRLWPLIALGALLGAMRFLMKGLLEHDESLVATSLFQTVTTLIMVPTGYEKVVELFPLNAPLWSLHFELLAYLAFGLWMFRARTRSLLILSGLAAAFYLWAESSEHVLGGGYLLGLSRICLSFPLGVVLCRERERFLELHLPSGAWLTLPMLALFALPRPYVPPIVALLVMLVAFPYVLISGSRVQLSPITSRLGKLSGEISYPLYVLHLPLMWTMNRSFLSLGLSTDEAIVWWGFLIIPSLVAMAYFAFTYFDKPVRRWLTSKIAPRIQTSEPKAIQANS